MLGTANSCFNVYYAVRSLKLWCLSSSIIHIFKGKLLWLAIQGFTDSDWKAPIQPSNGFKTLEIGAQYLCCFFIDVFCTSCVGQVKLGFILPAADSFLCPWCRQVPWRLARPWIVTMNTKIDLLVKLFCILCVLNSR